MRRPSDTDSQSRLARPVSAVVTLQSRGGLKVLVDNESDHRFLELADAFVIAAEKVERDPTRKVPRFSLRVPRR